MVNDWVRNCCKECSDQEGWYYNQKYENASFEEKQRIAEALAAEIVREERAEARAADAARDAEAAYAATRARAEEATRAAEAELKRQREAREAELAKEQATAEMHRRAAEARKAEAEKGGPPSPRRECTKWVPDLHEMRTQRTASILWIRKEGCRQVLGADA